MRSNALISFSAFLFLGIWSVVSAQSSYSGSSSYSDLFSVEYFGRSEYRSNDQFHTVIEDEEGYVLFGNNDGILIWDGEHWDLIKLPNLSVVTGLTRGPDGAIWAAGFNEIGRLHKDAYGKYSYESRTEELGLLNSGLEGIWSIFSYGESLILQYEEELVLIKGKVATRIKSRDLISFSGTINGMLLIQDRGHGVYALNPDTMVFDLLFREDKIDQQTIRAVFPGRNEGAISIITAEGGFFEFTLADRVVEKIFSVFDPSTKDEVNTAIVTGEGGYILGTKGSKLIQINADNSIDCEYFLNAKIKSRTVENLYRDRRGNIWVLLTKGLNYINFHSAYTHVLEGIPVFDVLLGSDMMYVATNQEVFLMSLDPARAGDRIKVSNLAGQVWSLNKIGDQILAGHQDGLFQLKGGRAEKLHGGTGFWGVSEIPGRNDLALGTTYDGFYLLKRDGDRLVVQGKVEGFNESTRDLAASMEDPCTFWVCHGYKGVYRVKFNKDYTKVVSTEFFTTFNGLESPYNILVRAYEGRIVFTTNTGVYTFNDEEHRFVPDPELNEILDPEKNTTFLEKAYGKLWFITEGSLGFQDMNDPEAVPVTMPFSDLKDTFIKTMECVIPLSEDRVLIGNNNGITQVELYSPSGETPVLMPTLISSVKRETGEGVEFLEVDPDGVPVLGNDDKGELHFEFANPELARVTKVYYSTKLEGYDRDWSAWSEDASRSFAVLSGGDYVFKVRSKGINGVEGDVLSYPFIVSKAWYETVWWYFVLGVMVLLLVFGVRLIVLKRIRKERVAAQKRLLQSETMMKLEMERYKLTLHQDQVEKEKQYLEKDVVEKSKELANYTLLLSKRKELFRELYDELRVLRKQIKNTENKKILSRVFNKLDNAKVDEKYLEIFDMNFERVHEEFISSLKETGVHLTRRELQLCALIKMDLSNKEIAPILNLSLRGVESARYRLRKKLEVDHSISLKEYFDSLELSVSG